MSLYRKHTRMSDAAAILRDVYGTNAAKKIARRFNVAVITAKVWLAGRFPEARTEELARAVGEELSRLEARHQQIRTQLGISNGTVGDVEASGEAGGFAAGGSAAAPGKADAGMGRDVGR